jgi:hypothetical protein
MFSQRRVIQPGTLENDEFRERLLSLASSESVRDEMEKDAHLIEAALQHDRIVLSRDDAMRQILRGLAAEIREVAQIFWSNPAVEEEGVRAWLKGGAKAEAARRLG